MEHLHHTDSPLGGITIASDGAALTGLWFDGQKNYGGKLDKNCAEKPLPVFEEANRWLDTYFSGKVPDFTPPLSLRGTAFQLAVWEILLTIPYGRTITYGQVAGAVAARLGLPRMSAQAVGGAVSRNPVSLIVPCHRIIGADGSLTGYAGGLDRKHRLLQLERAEPGGLPVPEKKP